MPSNVWSMQKLEVTRRVWRLCWRLHCWAISFLKACNNYYNKTEIYLLWLVAKTIILHKKRMRGNQEWNIFSQQTTNIVVKTCYKKIVFLFCRLLVILQSLVKAVTWSSYCCLDQKRSCKWKFAQRFIIHLGTFRRKLKLDLLCKKPSCLHLLVEKNIQFNVLKWKGY